MCFLCIAVCNVGVCLAIKQQVCDLRCMRIQCGWQPRWLLHSKQDFSGSRWLKKTAYELMADQRLKAEGVFYNWLSLVSTFTVSLSVLSARFGYCFIHTFSVSDLPLLHLRINKSIKVWKDNTVRKLSLTVGEINVANGSLWGTKWKSLFQVFLILLEKKERLSIHFLCRQFCHWIDDKTMLFLWCYVYCQTCLHSRTWQ